MRLLYHSIPSLRSILHHINNFCFSCPGMVAELCSTAMVAELCSTNLRGLDNPSRPRPCCTLACRCGRGPTQGTCKRELTAEGLLPSMRMRAHIVLHCLLRRNRREHPAVIPGMRGASITLRHIECIIREKQANTYQKFLFPKSVFLRCCFLRFFMWER